ncbi:neuferricin homolog [Pecten maximus]|uniref:neuferricin homolog n=1 Tax=Pecten maximus TaxID=6579 RepID=UPI00145893DF|nr:neuferricin homolog [Pecten maximus]
MMQDFSPLSRSFSDHRNQPYRKLTPLRSNEISDWVNHCFRPIKSLFTTKFGKHVSNMADAGRRTMNVGLFFVVFSLLFSASYCKKAKKSGGAYKQVEIDVDLGPEGAEAKRFTAAEIRGYDGRDSKKPLLMAVRGVVFDVSDGKDFYGPGAGYHALVGRDASRAIALWSLEEKDMVHDLSGLSDDSLKGLDDVFVGTYKKKYPVVGYMDYLIDTFTEKTFEDRFKEDL